MEGLESCRWLFLLLVPGVGNAAGFLSSSGTVSTALLVTGTGPVLSEWCSEIVLRLLPVGIVGVLILNPGDGIDCGESSWLVGSLATF